jgi:hypothetical protein
VLFQKAVDEARTGVSVPMPLCENCDHTAILMVDGYPDQIVDDSQDARPKPTTLRSVLCARCALVIAQRLLTDLRELAEAAL